MRLMVDGLNVTAHFDQRTVQLPDSDLAQLIEQIDFVLEDRGGVRAPEPRHGQAVELYDDDDITLLFSGRVSEYETLPRPVERAWRVYCQSWAVRLYETATGSHNKAGTIDTDRAFLIGILRDALKAQTFGAGTGLDDPIIAANEPDWTGVRGTARVVGMDWSYQPTQDALGSLMKRAPGVSLRLRPDLRVEYGRLREPAPFALSTSPDAAASVPRVAISGYREREITGDHRNKMRRGGAGAAEETAIDEVSYARFGRILEAPYENDETIPASALRQLAYAELRTHRTRRTTTAVVQQKGLRAGMVVDVAHSRLGNVRRPSRGAYPDMFFAVSGRSASGMAHDYRGRMQVQKVSTRALGAGVYESTLQLGDHQRDLPTALVAISAETA